MRAIRLRKHKLRRLSNMGLLRLAEYLEGVNFAAYVDLIQTPWRLALLNLIGGIFRGLGIGLGFTIIAGTIVMLLQQLEVLNIPTSANLSPIWSPSCKLSCTQDSIRIKGRGVAVKWDRIRKQLESEKREVETRRRVRNESADLGDSMRDEISELSMYDNHPADVASELFLRGMAVGDEVREEAYLEDIDEALKRIDAGTYGVCAECGREITSERLEAMPTARYCIDCQEDAERRKKRRHRPVEEDVLWPGFGAVWLDDHDQTGFDGEDAYQAVARFQEPLWRGNVRTAGSGRQYRLCRPD
ncbi:hypothetical protein GCM10025858_36950 [Alicyclobacillus sacchari]|uniref:TraR/DksA C4-type zinc finger protein n=1 Tax=Alicyclobacillus sacchari TaxID=392010 RepID=UPI0023EA1A71|nr:TraR/DksA C4-type zinc finger protein [Alicyclobacillus sacchari]GMA59192.1 hypothetical protein GCM10025858_36950 [Alicyclobacillus sacchari]